VLLSKKLEKIGRGRWCGAALVVLLALVLSVYKEQPNCYEILGVPVSASRTTIRHSFRETSKVYHPDSKSDQSTDSDRFVRLQRAQDILLSDASRKAYHKFGDSFHSANAPGEEPISNVVLVSIASQAFLVLIGWFITFRKCFRGARQVGWLLGSTSN